MAVRIEVQKRLTEMLENGTFYKVVYDSLKQPAVTLDTLAPGSVAVNEINNGLSASVRDTSSVTHAPVRVNWRFEVMAEFSSEVSTDYFFENEFKNLYFEHEGLLVNVVSSGDVSVSHPPRHNSHNGTKLTIGLTVNTRR